MRAHAWGRWLSVPLLAFASCARPAPPLDPPPPDDSLPAEACAPIDLEDPARFSACSKGSGSFGRWGLDEAGLPIYEYMIDQAADDSAVWFTTETLSDPSLEPRTHWAAFGNHRINATFSNDGVIEVVTQDRGVEYLNKLDDDRAWFGGGFSYIDDGEETFSTSYRDRPEHADTRRVFGMGYAEAATAYRDIVVVHRTYAPWGDAPYLIDEVSGVIEARRIKSLDEYQRTGRPGRRVPSGPRSRTRSRMLRARRSLISRHTSRASGSVDDASRRASISGAIRAWIWHTARA